MAGESAREVARRQREKAERLLRSAERYERGAEGEDTTASVLGGLPADWKVLHDVRWPGRPRANIDHVVIGPAGVFVVDSKNWSGRVVVRDSVLRQDGRARETAVVSAAEAALAVARTTTALTVNQVHPVLCILRDEPLDGWARDVMVTSTSTLLPMLLSRPVVLHPTRVAQAERDLRRALPRAVHDSTARATQPGRARQGLPVRSTRGSAPPGRAERPTRSRRRSPARDLRRLMVGLAMLAAVAFGAPYLPGLVEPIARQLTDHLVVDQPTRGDVPAVAPTQEASRAPGKKASNRSDTRGGQRSRQR